MPLTRKQKLFLILLSEARRKRQYWVRPILQLRKEKGFGNNLIEEMRMNDHESFFNFFRMTPSVFDELLSLIGPLIQKQSTNFRDSIPARDRLAITLRYLASGDMMKSLSYAFRVSPASTSAIIASVCEAITTVLEPTVLKQPELNEWLETAEVFLDKWQFPQCLGAIDGKHVELQAPPNSGSEFFNYKNHFSMVLLAVADASYKFLIVDVGAAGHQSDGGIFSRSVFGQSMLQISLKLPSANNIPGTNKMVPFVFIADEAFPLKENLMRPFPGLNLNLQNKIYNYRLSRARRCVENAFGILSSRFRVLRKPMHAKLSTVESVIKSAVCLHNYLMNADNSSGRRFYCPDGFADSPTPGSSPGSWRTDQDGGMRPLGRTGSNNYANRAVQVRHTFANYFANEGAVDWQLAIVNRK